MHIEWNKSITLHFRRFFFNLYYETNNTLPSGKIVFESHMFDEITEVSTLPFTELQLAPSAFFVK
jgi:hypothetical protein